ncbi:MAG: hypothetical protein JNL10_15780 [Verrucomicrobiales bacterium]|nr:hypothetical protein [Verrucomicrobiales bacterium]
MKFQPSGSGSHGNVLRSLLIAAVMMSAPTRAESDLDPPEIVSATASPGRVDTSGGPQVVKVVVRLRDALSGLPRFEGPFSTTVFPLDVFFRPSGIVRSAQRLSASLSAVTEAGGAEVNPFDAEYRGHLIVPPGATPGVWVLEGIGARDQVGNFLGANFSGSGLEIPGLVPPQFEVVGSEDALPPRIESIRFATNRVSLSELSQSVRILLRIRDDGTGIEVQQYPIGISFQGDRTGRTAVPSFGLNSGQRIEGTAQDGVYAFEVAFNRNFTPPDTYRLQPIQIRDGVGNFSLLMPSEAELRGFPTTITVEQDPGIPLDLEPPEFVSMKLTTETVDTSEGAGAVTAEIVIRDDDEGPVSASVYWVGPLGLHQTQLSGFRPPGGLPMLVCSGSFPAHCESGEWRVQRLLLTGGAGNVASLTGSELERRGMPTRIVVTTSPRLHVDRREGSTVAWWRRVPGTYHVQTSRNLQGWADLPAPLIGVGDNDVVVLRGNPAGSEDVFFRLIRD